MMLFIIWHKWFSWVLLINASLSFMITLLLWNILWLILLHGLNFILQNFYFFSQISIFKFQNIIACNINIWIIWCMYWKRSNIIGMWCISRLWCVQCLKSWSFIGWSCLNSWRCWTSLINSFELKPDFLV